MSDGRPIPAESEYNDGMAESKQKPKPKPKGEIDFESFVRAAMQTGKPSAKKKEAAKRRPRKGGK